MKKLVFFNSFKQTGIGLVELMVSMVIGLFVMAGVVQMFSTTGQNAVASAGLSRIQENSRYVFTRIAEDIAQTGNLGCVSVSNANLNDRQFMNAMLGLAAGAGEANDFSSIVNGDEGATSSTDPAGSVTTGTDTLRIRYVNHNFKIPLTVTPEFGSIVTSITVDSAHPNYPRLQQFQVVALTNCSIGSIFMITNDPTSSAGIVEFVTGVVSDGINPGQFNAIEGLEGAHFYAVGNDTSPNQTAKKEFSRSYLYGGTTGSYLYFIGTSARADADGNTCILGRPANGTVPAVTGTPQHCALFRRQRGVSVELVDGVSNMEVFYGWTSEAGALFFAQADDVTDWARVDRVRVKMDFNSVEGATSNGSTIDSTGLLERTVERTFILSNQL